MPAETSGGGLEAAATVLNGRAFFTKRKKQIFLLPVY